MSAETLREAARLMRERAEGATPGVWESWSGASGGGGEYISAKSPSGKFHYTFGIKPGLVGEAGWRVAKRDAEHVASWHPAVALAVADLLDQAADLGHVGGFPAYDAAHAVATAYLGQPAPTDASP